MFIIIMLIFVQLLDHEVHAREQVPLLMEMKKADLALDKAIESGDPQLGNNRLFMKLFLENKCFMMKVPVC